MGYKEKAPHSYFFVYFEFLISASPGLFLKIETMPSYFCKRPHGLKISSKDRFFLSEKITFC
jgi:hypothetical protein